MFLCDYHTHTRFSFDGDPAATHDAMCRRALEEDPGFVSQRRRDHGAAAAWSTRASELVEILRTAGLL